MAIMYQSKNCLNCGRLHFRRWAQKQVLRPRPQLGISKPEVYTPGELAASWPHHGLYGIGYRTVYTWIPKSMSNDGLSGCFERLWAIMLHTVGGQVGL